MEVSTEPVPTVASELPVLTSGQAKFLENLDAGQRAAFDAWAADEQAKALAPHRLGFDRVMAGDVIRRLNPPPPPPPPVPPTTAELLERLPGGPKDWSVIAAEGMAQDFGAKKDRQLWGQFSLIAECIRLGLLAPEPVLNAYRQAMRPEIKKPGAKFWAAFQGLTGFDSDALRDLAAGKGACDG
jgi:hypothetical protein